MANRPRSELLPEEIASFAEMMQEILAYELVIDENQEHFWAIGLSAEYDMVYLDRINQIRKKKELVIRPISVFTMAREKECPYLIFCHSHPNGIMEPTEVIKDTVSRVIKASIIANVTVADVLIISRSNYYSFWQSGLLTKLKEDGAFQLSYLSKVIKKIKAIKEGNPENALKEMLEVAKDMLDAGMGIRAIAAFTGLQEKQVRELKAK